MAGKKEIRNKFRNAVYTRDKFTCKCCKTPITKPQNYSLLDPIKGLDAHHITDRNDMPKGGYVAENGISLCDECHMKAEKFHQTDGKEWVEGFHPDDLYKLIGSSYNIAHKKSLKL